MTPERFNKVENSVGLLVEAVAELRTIARVVVVEHGTRIKDLEHDVDNIKTTIYESCDIKTREIDDKIAGAISDTKEIISVNFKYTLWMSGAILTLGGVLVSGFIMYMSYSDANNSDLQSKISIRESVSVRNGENIIHLKEELKEVKADVHEILSRINK